MKYSVVDKSPRVKDQQEKTHARHKLIVSVAEKCGSFER